MVRRCGARVRAAFGREWVTPSGRLANETQTAYSLAICFGLLSPEQEQHAAARLVELTAKAGWHIGTGFAGTPWLLPALSRTGHVDVAYRVLTQTTPPSFLYPLTMGATTIWERWDSVLPDGTLNSTGMTSLNHYALGAVADWLHRVVGGIEPLEPGYRRCRIAPQPGGGLSWARTAHDTVHGRIEVAWDASPDQRSVRVEIPPGVDSGRGRAGTSRRAGRRGGGRRTGGSTCLRPAQRTAMRSIRRSSSSGPIPRPGSGSPQWSTGSSPASTT